MKCSNKLKKQSENKNQENKQKPKFLSTLKETCDQSSVSRLILILITTNDYTISISITGHVQNPPAFKIHPIKIHQTQNPPDQNQPGSTSTRSKSTQFKIHPVQNPPDRNQPVSKSIRSKSIQFKIHPIEINPSQNPPDQNQPGSKSTRSKSTRVKIHPHSKSTRLKPTKFILRTVYQSRLGVILIVKNKL